MNSSHGIFPSTGVLRARWSILMVLVTAVLISGATVGYARHVQSQIECLTGYNTALQQRAQVLADVAAEDRQVSADAEDAIAALITQAVAAGGDQAKGQAAADRYLATTRQIAARRAELERQRRAHPFPPLPEKTCT